MNKIHLLVMASLMSCLGHEPPTSECNRLYLFPELSTKRINSSAELIALGDHLTGEIPFGSKATIITILQADCPVCIQELYGWRSFMMEQELPKGVNFCIVAIGYASEYFLHQVHKENFPFPVFLDENHNFINENDIPEMIGEHTMVLDPGQMITFVGSPVLNPYCAPSFNHHIEYNLSP